MQLLGIPIDPHNKIANMSESQWRTAKGDYGYTTTYLVPYGDRMLQIIDSPSTISYTENGSINYTNDKGQDMSFVLAIQNRNGIVIVSDSYESRVIEDGKFCLNRNYIKKVFTSDRLVVGVCGVSCIFVNGKESPLSGLIDRILLHFRGNGIDFAMELYENIRNTDTFGRIRFSCDIIIGERIKDKFGYRISNIEITANGMQLRQAFQEPAFISNGGYNMFPGNSIMLDSGIEKMEVGDMVTFGKNAVHSVIKAGNVFVENGLMHYFPVGGEIRTSILV